MNTLGWDDCHKHLLQGFVLRLASLLPAIHFELLIRATLPVNSVTNSICFIELKLARDRR